MGSRTLSTAAPRRRPSPGPGSRRLITFAVVAILAPAVTVVGAAASPPPNIVLITVDTLRADHLGCYGYNLTTSPTIDRLAREGVRFADCTVPWPKTWSSMASLMTGLSPRTTGIRERPRWLRASLPVLSERFAAAGSATAAVVGNLNVGRIAGFERGFDHFVEAWTADGAGAVGAAAAGPGGVEALTDAASITDQALTWLAQRPPGRPFFLWLHYMDPHGPYHPPSAYAHLFRGAHRPRPVPLDALPPYQVQHTADGRPITDLAHYKAQYDREVRSLDDELGRLLAELDHRDLAGSTLLVLTADHGESLDEHGAFLEHGELSYQADARVPLILRWPGRLAPGRVVTDPVGLIDLTATVLELAGLTAPPELESTSLAALARGEAGARAPGHVFMEAGAHPGRSQLTVRAGRWKLIQVRAEEDRARMQGTPLELYDLTADPGEVNNLADEHPDVVHRLLATLREWEGVGPEVEVGGDIDPETLDAAEIEMLKALGYLDGGSGSGPDQTTADPHRPLPP